MTKRQENEVFVKMLKEFPKAFGRVSFRDRLMLRTAVTYIVDEVQKQISLEEKELKDQNTNLQIMLKAEREVRCNDCPCRCDKPNIFKKLSDKKECYSYSRSYNGFLAGAEEVKVDCEFALEGKDLEIKELKEELQKWKDEWQEQVQKAIDEGWERTQQTIQLTKAKELLNKAILTIEELESDYDEDKWVRGEDLCEEMKQFLKDIKE